MSHNEPTPLNRRELLRNSGIVLSLGALLAACGGDAGSTAAGRIGVEMLPESDDLDTTVDDAVLLRTLQSLEYSTINIHTALLDAGWLTGDAATLAQRFIDEHQRHADEIGELVSQAGGDPFECANSFRRQRIVTPLLAAIESSDDAERDAVEVANGFENNMAASYQALVAQLTDGALRAAVMRIGNEECRHASALALAVHPDAIAPELAPPAPADDAEGEGDGEGSGDDFPTFFAIPAPFGQLTGITLVVGEADEDGARPSVQLQTPAENTFVYHGLSC